MTPNKGFNYLHDCQSQKIPVPCGKCPQCVALKQNYFVQRCQMESFGNYLFFGTLTYNPASIRNIVVNGYKLDYADFTDVQKMFKRIRKSNKFTRLFKYQVVSEYGGKRHRPHYHLLLSIPKFDTDDKWTPYNLEKIIHDSLLSEWRRNYGSTRLPIYKPLCDYVVTTKGRTFDLHYVRPSATSAGESDVAFYVSKYMCKYSKYVDSLHSALKLNTEPDEFKEVWKLLAPKCVRSHDWGDCTNPKVRDHIRKGIDIALRDPKLFYPIFINPISGHEFPLSPYYRKKFITLEDAHTFYYKFKEYPDLYDSIVARSDIEKSERLWMQHMENLILLSDREESENIIFDY